MASYQGMSYIQQQVESIYSQLLPDDELVISDNGSTDGTYQYLQKIAQSDSRINLYQLYDEKGILANFQNAIKKSRGELIFLSDQDDVWLSGRLEQMTSCFEKNPDLLAVQSDAELIDESGQLILPSFFTLRHCGSGVWKNFHKNTWQGCSMGIRRSLLKLALPFPKGLPMHDMWLGILADMAGKTEFIPDVLTQYRRHAGNQSELKPAVWYQVIIWRIRLAWALLSRVPQIHQFHRFRQLP